MSSGNKTIIITDAELLSKPSKNTADIIGQKALGLIAIPAAWRPPFGVIKASVYAEWFAAKSNRQKKEIIQNASRALIKLTQKWDRRWDRGIILRSSATKETINERGSFESQPLAADFNESMVEQALDKLYRNYETSKADGELAIVVQALVNGRIGHSSNVRRVSKTTNQWEWSWLDTPHIIKRFNANRYDFKSKNVRANQSKELAARQQRDFAKLLQAAGRWCISLERGPGLLEWAQEGKNLWLLQIDFEDESPDLGYDPKQFHREVDLNPPGEIPEKSYLTKLNNKGKLNGWGKADKVRDLIEIRSDKYPPLFLLKGKDISLALRDRKKLASDIEQITHGRAVCRTDCNSTNIEKLNLPRTDSIAPTEAVNFIKKTYDRLRSEGAKASEICFIIHKFIPALACAWALAYPEDQVVKVDSLWGVPDGLQFFPHDSFEVDTTLKKITERLRYKPFFIQELKNGEWKRIAVKRSAARGTSVSRPDLMQIAIQTRKLAKKKNEPVLVMWFCEIPDQLEIGRNIPWFTMKPEDDQGAVNPAPQKPPFFIKNAEDLKAAMTKAAGHILLLEPEVQLIREVKFLEKVIKLAKQKNLPVQIQGSTLCHAFYMLQKAGVEVYPSNPPKHIRTRGKRTFRKIVRDAIPEKILEGGEQVVLAKIHKSEARTALITKLFEEAFELKAAQTPNQVKEELADVLEVVKSLANATGIDWAEIEEASSIKRQERGSFQDNVVLLETSWFSQSKKNSQPTSKPISLKSLAKVLELDRGVELSFPSVLSNPDGILATLPNGTMLRISVSSNGVKIVEQNNDGEEEQLTLPFFDPEQG